MSDNTKHWDAMAKPPAETLRKIAGGRLKGMTDIKPQWRYLAMTEQFGPCGIGWKYIVTKQWLEPGDGGQQVAFVTIDLFVKVDDVWSEAIPGSGGSLFIANESNGPHTSDEAYKMATTDALSVAMKMLGVGAAVYLGEWTGSKYRNDPPTALKPPKQKQPEKPPGVESETQVYIDGAPDANGVNWTLKQMQSKSWSDGVRVRLWDALTARAAEIGCIYNEHTAKFEAKPDA